MELLQFLLHCILLLLHPILQDVLHRHLCHCMVYDVCHVVFSFGISFHLYAPQIVNALHQGCCILLIPYIYYWTVGIVVRYFLVLLFLPSLT